jgi:peroxiredoxin
MPDFEVTDLPPADPPAEGEQAPDFTRPLVNEEYWEDTALSAVTAEGPVLLVFHPMDGSPRTTYIYNEIRAREWDQREDVSIVGVSISTPYAHSSLVEDRGVDVRLFSDPGNGVAREYGVVNDRIGMAGIEEPRPAVFLLDTDRTVLTADVAEEWPDPPDYEALAGALAEL